MSATQKPSKLIRKAYGFPGGCLAPNADVPTTIPNNKSPTAHGDSWLPGMS